VKRTRAFALLAAASTLTVLSAGCASILGDYAEGVEGAEGGGSDATMPTEDGGVVSTGRDSASDDVFSPSPDATPGDDVSAPGEDAGLDAPSSVDANEAGGIDAAKPDAGIDAGGCTSGFHECSGSCVSNTSIATCGASCTACAPPSGSTATCDGTSCGFTCGSATHACGSACANNNALATCGTSCTPCPAAPADATETCNGTSCGFACNSEYHLCGAACASALSINSCGTSCSPCTPPSDSTATCNGTSCGFTCVSGYHVCGSACALNTWTAACGTSCTACTGPADSTLSCDGTSCGFTCNSGYEGATCNPIVRYGHTGVACSVDNSFGANDLLGEVITISKAITITALATTTSPAGGFNGLMALYTNDASNAPGSLVVSTPPTALSTGANEIPVTPTAVAAGTYWLMGDYPSGGTICTDGVDSQTIDYVSLAVGAAPPNPFPATFSSYNGFIFGYYVVGY
jgi:hypothetical protein